MTEIRIERATLTDVEAMKGILDHFAAEGQLLARSRLDLYEGIRDFWVAREGDALVGVAALHVCWIDLGEVRSLAVRPDRQGRGAGRRLVDACLAEARDLGLRRLFALTYRPGFFSKVGFREVPKSGLPHKVWQVCIQCVKFPDCDEVAMMREMDP